LRAIEMGILRDAKDKLMSVVLRTVINNVIRDLGSLSQLSIDTINKGITVVVNLKGEVQPIEFNVFRYEIIHDDDKFFLSFKEVRASREWINILIDKYLTIRRIELPNSVVGKAAELLL
jgi:hypothetical protein